jgi:hypothetical protein
MKKALFFIIALIFISFAGEAQVPKYELYKPYPMSRRQYLQIKLDHFSTDANLIHFGKIHSTVLVLPDKIEYDLLVSANISSDEVKTRKDYLIEGTNEITGRYSWSKGLPVEFNETQIGR